MDLVTGMIKQWGKKKLLLFLLGGGGGTAFLVILSMMVVVLIISNVAASSSSPTSSSGYIGLDITEIGENEIPADFIPIYKEAEEKYGVPWNLLAAVHRVETHFSTNVKDSYAGAKGHLQFMTCTWVGWSYSMSACKSSNGNANIPHSDLIDPKIIKKHGGYGVDANGDGKADPMQVEDAIFSAAKLLSQNGASKGDLSGAVYTYNKADWYVEEVLGFANLYASGYESIEVGNGSQTSGVNVVDVGKKWIGKSLYVFGGGRNSSDISRGRFDCSSFVHWAFKQVGIDLGPLTSTSTETLKHLGKTIDPAEIQPGDIVFFDTYKIDGHVGIYAGNGKFIGAQSSTGVAIADMTTGYWKTKFNGRVKRI